MHARSSDTNVANIYEKKVSISPCHRHDGELGRLECSIPKLDCTLGDAHERVADRLCLGSFHSDADVATAPPLVPVETDLRLHPRALLATEYALEQPASRLFDQRITK